jgi:hypothetical protein
MTAPGPDPRDRPPPEATEGEGRWINIVIIGIVALVIVTGLWLVDALLAARKADECISSGRRDCAVEVSPPR